jgi:hypothetical protein
MPSTDRKLELKAKTSVAQTASQAAVCAKGLNHDEGTAQSVHWQSTDNSSVKCINMQVFVARNLLGRSPACGILTLCRSNLNPYCLGRKAAFFSALSKQTNIPT